MDKEEEKKKLLAIITAKQCSLAVSRLDERELRTVLPENIVNSIKEEFRRIKTAEMRMYDAIATALK